MTQIRFPGESPQYRAARDHLQAAELELTRQIEAVAQLRRRLPLGGPVPIDYTFTQGPADLGTDRPTRPIRLSELFPPGQDTVLLYSFMYGPDEDACRMCTSLLDGLDGAIPDVTRRVGFAVVAKSPIERIRAYARDRGWVQHRLLSSAGTSYNLDYHGENADGSQSTMLNVFVRRDGQVHHFYGSEKTGRPVDPGQDDRHVDLLWPLWNALDLTPAGRGDWRPSFSPKSTAAARAVGGPA